MNFQRKTALVAGVFFVITFVTSIRALLLYEPLLDHADYILGPLSLRKRKGGSPTAALSLSVEDPVRRL